MSTLHKVKAYFGMAPMEDYDDEYYEDDDRTSSRGYTRRSREDRFDDDGYLDRAGRGYEGRDYDEPPAGYRGGYHDEDRFESRLRGPRDFDRPTPRFSALRGSTRGALAMDPRRMAELFDAGSPLCLGSDSHAVIDLFEEARALAQHERLRTERRGNFAADELLDVFRQGPVGDQRALR